MTEPHQPNAHPAGPPEPPPPGAGSPAVSRRSLAGAGLAGAALAGAGALGGVLVSRSRSGRDALRAGPGELGPAFAYDLSAYQKTDPATLHYRPSARFDTGFKRARGVATGAGDRLLVAGDSSLRLFGPDGARLAEWPIDGDRPRAAAEAADGTVYVALKDRVLVFDAAGKRTAAWDPASPGSFLTSIAAGEADVFAADAGRRVVYRYDRSGKLLRQIGVKDEKRGIPGFAVPSPYFDVAIAPDGLLRVANTGRLRIETYTFDGDLERWWGKPSLQWDGFSGCCNPSHFALLPNGEVITSEKGLVRIKRSNEKGEWLGAVAGPEHLLDGRPEMAGVPGPDADGAGAAFDVAIDSKGRVLALDPYTQAIRIFERI
jgi:hypothetical protein